MSPFFEHFRVISNPNFFFPKSVPSHFYVAGTVERELGRTPGLPGPMTYPAGTSARTSQLHVPP